MLIAQQGDKGGAKASPSRWNEALQECAYIPVEYLSTYVAYQTAYFGLEDKSEVLMHDNKPVGVWPLGIRDGLWVTSNGTEILPPLLADWLPERVQKRIVADCLRRVQELAVKYGAPNWGTSETSMDGGLSLWHRRCMELGGDASVSHALYVNVGLNTADILLHMARKSYRSLIAQGRKEFISSLSLNVAPLKDLHIAVSGRQTRSDATWEAQQASVDAGEAFCVYLHDRELRLVGGALFHVSRDESMYAVGAYDRNLHDKPLGHLVQYQAIEHLCDLDLPWHYLGQRFYEGVSDKELQIAHFKEGWATHVFPRVTTNLHP